MSCVDQSVSNAYQDIRDDSTDTTWAAFEYGEDQKSIECTKSGANYSDFLELLADDNRVYAYIRMETGDEMSRRAKFAFITWIGSNVSVLKKAKVSTDKAFVKHICNSFAVEILTSERDDLTEEAVKSLITKAGGAAYGTGKRD